MTDFFANAAGFFAYDAGPVLAVILFIGLPMLALYQARTFVKRL